MRSSKCLLAQGGFLLLALFGASCSEALQQREMEVRVNGIYCDPDHSILIAQSSNLDSIDKFDDLKRVELYRTQSGRHFFVQDEEGYDMKVELLSTKEAKDLYNELSYHPIDFTQAFAD